MNNLIATESINCLGTKDIQINVTEKGFVLDIIAWGEWYTEEAKDVKELEELLNEFNVQKYVIKDIKEQIEKMNAKEKK